MFTIIFTGGADLLEIGCRAAFFQNTGISRAERRRADKTRVSAPQDKAITGVSRMLGAEYEGPGAIASTFLAQAASHSGAPSRPGARKKGAF